MTSALLMPEGIELDSSKISNLDRLAPNDTIFKLNSYGWSELKIQSVKYSSLNNAYHVRTCNDHYYIRPSTIHLYRFPSKVE